MGLLSQLCVKLAVETVLKLFQQAWTFYTVLIDVWHSPAASSSLGDKRRRMKEEDQKGRSGTDHLEMVRSIWTMPPIIGYLITLPI